MEERIQVTLAKVLGDFDVTLAGDRSVMVESDLVGAAAGYEDGSLDGEAPLSFDGSIPPD